MFKSILSDFFNNVRKQSTLCCFISKEHGKWKRYTWSDIASLVHLISNGFKKYGIKKGERIAIISSTSMMWSVIDLAILNSGAVTVPIYPTFPAERIKHILKDANARFVFFENDDIFSKLKKACLELTEKPQLIRMYSEGKSQEDEKTINDILKIGATCGENPHECENVNINKEDVATIIYTSGTTGNPKGVVITHGNIMAEIVDTGKLFDFQKQTIGLLCLPLSHVLGRLMLFHQISKGYQLAFLESYEKFIDNCKEIRPHFIVGVPRMLEKLYEGICNFVDRGPLWRKKLFWWGINTCAKIKTNKEKSLFTDFLKCKISEDIVLKKFKHKLGGRINLFISGGAALRKDVAEFFHSLGLLVLEGYGLTETFAAATVNRIDDFKFGTVGKPIPSIEIKIASDHEILVKGPTIFREYFNLPEETKQVKTSDGWFCTGDIGEITEDGFLKITDRKKEVFVTSQGKNISPQIVEVIMMQSKYINYCMVYGDGKKYLTALITLNKEVITNKAKELGIKGEYEKIVKDSKIYDLILQEVEDKNKELARHETVKKFIIISKDFESETHELTPTLKLRRKFITEKYKEQLEELYD